MSEEICENCKYCIPLNLQMAKYPMGYCRFNPPIGTEFPKIKLDNFCSKFTLK